MGALQAPGHEAERNEHRERHHALADRRPRAVVVGAGLGGLSAAIHLALLFLAPFGFLIGGIATRASWTLLCAAQVAIILLIRAMQAARFGHWASVPLFPLAVAAVIAIQWGSLWQARFHRPVGWKGRIYS